MSIYINNPNIATARRSLANLPSCDNPGMRFRPPSAVATAVAIVVVLMTTACGISTPSNNTKDTISGTIPVGGSDSHDFTVNKNGEVEVTVTSLTPSPSASLGMGLGQPTSGTCGLIQGYVAALVANRTAPFGYLNKGNYCLLVYDTGILTTATAYSATISHP